MKELSIILPVYNVENYISHCLDSLLKIENINYEILLINDGSTDKSREICDKYAQLYNTIITVIHKENGGVSSARNKGLELANGEWIFFCDPDDWIDSKLFSNIDLNSDFDLINFGYSKDYNNKSFKVSNKAGIYNTEKDFLHTSFYGVCFTLLRQDIIKNNNISFSSNLKLGEDIEFIIKYLSFSKKYIVYQECIYHYVVRENSAMNSLSTQRRNVYDSLILLENIYEWFEKRTLPNWLELRIARIAKNAIYSAFKSKIPLSELMILSKRFRKIRGKYQKYGYLKNLYFLIASINFKLCFPLLYIKYKK